MIFYWLLCVYVVNVHIMRARRLFICKPTMLRLSDRCWLFFCFFSWFVCRRCWQSVPSILWFYLVKSTRNQQKNGTRFIDLCAEEFSGSRFAHRCFFFQQHICEMSIVITDQKISVCDWTVMKFVNQTSWKYMNTHQSFSSTGTWKIPLSKQIPPNHELSKSISRVHLLES